jgi:hypothetical protein
MMTALVAWSQKPYVEIFVEPANVEVGEQFNVIVKSNISGEIDINLPDEFEQGYNVMNRMEQEYDGNTGEVITYFFHGRSGSLTAEGKFIFGPAHIKKGNKVYRSNKVTVLSTNEVSSESNTVSPNLLQKQACGVIETSKDKVYAGEAFVVKSKVLSKFKPTHYDSYRTYQFSPAADQHKLSENDQPMVAYGTYHGQRRFVFEHDKQVVFLNTTGRVKIEPFIMTLQSGFDGFEVRSKKNHIRVIPLPKGAPTSFTGGVGKFEIASETDKKTIRQGEVVTYTLILKGSGNLQDVNKPKVNFGEHFKVYGDPEIKENFSYTSNGAEGEIRMLYHLQAIKDGNVSFGKIVLSYFDPEAEVYKTVSTVPEKISIEKNADFVVENNSSDEKTNAKIDNFSSGEKNNDKSFFSGSTVKWIGISAPICLAFLFLLFRRKKEDAYEDTQEKPEITPVTPISQKRNVEEYLSILQAHANNGNDLPFFTQLSKDLQTSVSQVAREDENWVLSKEEKQQFFYSKGYSADFQSNYFGLQQTCELCRYGCQKPDDNLQVYVEKAKVIFETLQK